MSDVWVVVASSTQCRIFTQQKHSEPLLQIDELFHPEGRLRGSELTEDRPGRSFDSRGEGRHAMGQPVDPVEQENIRFARIVATSIEEARKKGAFERLLLVVEPRFLGHLRKHLSGTTRQLVTAEVQKNLVDADPEAIRSALPYRI
jgi:protein required for attachment to host cells